jgi:NADH:ubiquinone oxidoreductase subunit B-like Fe-S oxidoreductase
VTFWSGFVLTRAASCIPLDVYIDGAPSARRVGLALGRRCAQ